MKGVFAMNRQQADSPVKVRNLIRKYRGTTMAREAGACDGKLLRRKLTFLERRISRKDECDDSRSGRGPDEAPNDGQHSSIDAAVTVESADSEGNAAAKSGQDGIQSRDFQPSRTGRGRVASQRSKGRSDRGAQRANQALGEETPAMNCCF